MGGGNQDNKMTSYVDLLALQKLDTVERSIAIATWAKALQNDEKALSNLATEALNASVFDNYMLSMNMLELLKGADNKIVAVNSLALQLAQCAFTPVRHGAVLSGLLSNEAAVNILLNGRTELKKSV